MDNLLNSQSLIEDLNISFSSTLAALCLSVISAVIIRFLYINYGRSLNNREYFGNTFILLSVATCTVIIIVKYSLALSLGLVGALSIVRFRAAIKEPEELVYLFLVIALGLAYGANQFLIGSILLVISALVIFLSSKFIHSKKSYDHTGLVIVISGPKSKVKEIRNKKLESILQLNTYTILKEIEYYESTGRLVLKASLNENVDNLIEEFEKLINDEEINLNIISDISVPA